MYMYLTRTVRELYIFQAPTLAFGMFAPHGLPASRLRLCLVLGTIASHVKRL